MLTTLGRHGIGEGVNDAPASAMAYTHDIFHRAAEEGLDVFMLCGSLQSELRETQYRALIGETFAELCEGVLSAGHDVSIFVWARHSEGMVCDSLLKLLRESRQQSDWGNFLILFSGTSDGSNEIAHFLVARDITESRWLVRIEQPHGRDSLDDGELSTLTTAAILFGSTEAQSVGKKLLRVFDGLVASVRLSPTKNPSMLAI